MIDSTSRDGTRVTAAGLSDRGVAGPRIASFRVDMELYHGEDAERVRRLVHRVLAQVRFRGTRCEVAHL